MRQYYIAACLLIKDENSYINEWLEWHIQIGVEHFFIYDNGSVVPIVSSINERFLPYCSVVDFPDPHTHTQKDCYADCLSRFGETAEWIAFIDTDEFIRVVDGRSISEFLKDYEDHDGLYVKWTVYNADGQIYKEDRPVRDRFHKIVPYQKGRPCGKSIVRPEKIKSMDPHFPSYGYRNNIVDENHKHVYLPILFNYPMDKITIDHYFTRSLEEWDEKIRRGSCDPNAMRWYDEFYYYNPDLKGSVKSVF